LDGNEVNCEALSILFPPLAVAIDGDQVEVYVPVRCGLDVGVVVWVQLAVG